MLAEGESQSLKDTPLLLLFCYNLTQKQMSRYYGGRKFVHSSQSKGQDTTENNGNKSPPIYTHTTQTIAAGAGAAEHK
jgi:hypothetical protein